MMEIEKENSILIIQRDAAIADLIEIVAIEGGLSCVKSCHMPEKCMLEASNMIIVDLVTVQGHCHFNFEKALESIPSLEQEIHSCNTKASLVFLASLSAPRDQEFPMGIPNNSSVLRYPFTIEELESALNIGTRPSKADDSPAAL